MVKEPIKVKVDTSKLTKYYFSIDSDMVEVYASTISKATEIMEAQFPDDRFVNLEPIGSLVEHSKDVYRKNLISKYNG